ncbi:(Acyl-carrier-protein) synthase [Hyella patelloides LEGE 07179]|uniref:(Acyl-carrier-protein) synthase n=1 Tax=Hyella patelloides LEGE 07179 TaxID=945734 RepID=A0A563W200_9CYAN|nr:4'-phosphopantetheinyl transferase superfamily protein [Hyella patelloides]VEP17563.1 (Acyl-carrier-protein) synthase [Hyella patelloides LEGE 07179]
MFFNRVSYIYKNRGNRCNVTIETEAKGLGVDLVSVTRIAKLIAGHDLETLQLVFTNKEIDYCHGATDSIYSYALCFGIKEAVAKALATGLVGIDWNEIEVDLTGTGKWVCLQGKAKIQAKKLNIQQWHVDWWRLDNHLLVNVIATSKK